MYIAWPLLRVGVTMLLSIGWSAKVEFFRPEVLRLFAWSREMEGNKRMVGRQHEI